MHNLKELHRLLPEGLVADSQWMGQRGFTSDMLSRHVQSGWLERLARGVYRRPGPPLRWQQVVISLQALLIVPVAVAGTTALRLQGYAARPNTGAHEGDVWLTSPDPLPPWVWRVQTNGRFRHLRSGTLWRNRPPPAQAARGLNPAMTLADYRVHRDFVRRHWGTWNWPLVMSCEERALLEACHPITGHQESSFDLPLRSSRSLHHFHWGRLQSLLETCRSKRTKRLALWMAERSGVPLARHLNLGRVDMGRSVMRLVPPGARGQFCPGQRLYVPAGLYGTVPGTSDVS